MGNVVTARGVITMSPRLCQMPYENYKELAIQFGFGWYNTCSGKTKRSSIHCFAYDDMANDILEAGLMQYDEIALVGELFRPTTLRFDAVWIRMIGFQKMEHLKFARQKMANIVLQGVVNHKTQSKRTGMDRLLLHWCSNRGAATNNGILTLCEKFNVPDINVGDRVTVHGQFVRDARKGKRHVVGISPFMVSPAYEQLIDTNKF